MNPQVDAFRRFQRLITLFNDQPFSLYIIRLTKYFFIGHLFTDYVGITKGTKGPSMLPTLAARDDWVYVSKLNRRGRWVQVGDVVSIKHPMAAGVRAVKRVVGMPGDFVMMDTPGSGSDKMIQVPEGHCWVTGDNLPESRDSRVYGPIPLALITGKVVAKVLPLLEMKWMENTLQPPEAQP